MKPEEEIIKRINQSLQNMKDEINNVEYSGEEIGVRLTVENMRSKIVFFNPPVHKVLVEFSKRKRVIRGSKK
jgi:hypothetical protein